MCASGQLVGCLDTQLSAGKHARVMSSVRSCLSMCKGLNTLCLPVDTVYAETITEIEQPCYTQSCAQHKHTINECGIMPKASKTLALSRPTTSSQETSIVEPVAAI